MHVHFKLWNISPNSSTEVVSIYTSSSSIQNHLFVPLLPTSCFINHFLNVVNVMDEKQGALYYLNLYFFSYELRGAFSPEQYICISNHIRCPFSNELLYFFLLLCKTLRYIKTCASCVSSRFLVLFDFVKYLLYRVFCSQIY